MPAALKRLPDGRDPAALRPDGTSRWVYGVDESVRHKPRGKTSNTQIRCTTCDWAINLSTEKDIPMKKHVVDKHSDIEQLFACRTTGCKSKYLTQEELERHRKFL